MILGPFWSDWQDLAKSRDERKQKGRFLPSSGHPDVPFFIFFPFLFLIYFNIKVILKYFFRTIEFHKRS